MGLGVVCLPDLLVTCCDENIPFHTLLHKDGSGLCKYGNSVRARLKTGENICLGANMPPGLGSYRGTQEDEL